VALGNILKKRQMLFGELMVHGFFVLILNLG